MGILMCFIKKKNWTLVGHAVCEFVKCMWQEVNIISSINSTLLVLISKVDKLEFILQFRPIALSNIIYKCLTKVVGNRIKPLLDKCISPLQARFVPGRHIQDNIIIAHELIHSMSRMKGRKGFMTIKIDLEKTYDRLFSAVHSQLFRGSCFSKELD